jgi:hypothetical protein
MTACRVTYELFGHTLQARALYEDNHRTMATVTIDGTTLRVKLSLLDAVLTFHSSFEIPLAHVTNAYVSDFADLELQYRLEGTNWGLLKAAGVFANPQGLIFVDTGEGNCLVIETRGERFPRIAVQVSNGDPNSMAHEIMQAVPDSGPTD